MKRVADLEGGPELDYWVARAEGRHNPRIAGFDCLVTEKVEGIDTERVFRPSSYWNHGGPIIEREGICWNHTVLNREHQEYRAHIDAPEPVFGFGRTQLEAAMRCFVASKFGEEVPDE